MEWVSVMILFRWMIVGAIILRFSNSFRYRVFFQGSSFLQAFFYLDHLQLGYLIMQNIYLYLLLKLTSFVSFSTGYMILMALRYHTS